MAKILSRDGQTVVRTHERYHFRGVIEKMASRGFELDDNTDGSLVFSGPPVVTKEDYLEATGSERHRYSWNMLRTLAHSVDRPIHIGGPLRAGRFEPVSYPDMPGRFLGNYWFGTDVLSNMMIASTLPPSAEWGQAHVAEIPYFTQKMADDWSRAADSIMRLTGASH